MTQVIYNLYNNDKNWSIGNLSVTSECDLKYEPS